MKSSPNNLVINNYTQVYTCQRQKQIIKNQGVEKLMYASIDELMKHAKPHDNVIVMRDSTFCLGKENKENE